jgi:5-formyltetrahydrofolate cyclo-ligase
VKDLSFSNSTKTKAELRAWFTVIANTVWSNQERAHSLIERLKFILPAGKTIAGFKALKNEPDLGPLYDVGDYRFVFPRVEGENMRFYRSKSAKSFVASSWGILEPEPTQSESVEPSAIDIFLVPGLAFDRKLFRLGRGRGFYDRALTAVTALKIGIAASSQISNLDLVTEDHDCPMDMVVTEKYFLKRLRA